MSKLHCQDEHKENLLFIREKYMWLMHTCLRLYLETKDPHYIDRAKYYGQFSKEISEKIHGR